MAAGRGGFGCGPKALLARGSRGFFTGGARDDGRLFTVHRLFLLMRGWGVGGHPRFFLGAPGWPWGESGWVRPQSLPSPRPSRLSHGHPEPEKMRASAHRPLIPTGISIWDKKKPIITHPVREKTPRRWVKKHGKPYGKQTKNLQIPDFTPISRDFTPFHPAFLVCKKNPHPLVCVDSLTR